MGEPAYVTAETSAVARSAHRHRSRTAVRGLFSLPDDPGRYVPRAVPADVQVRGRSLIVFDESDTVPTQSSRSHRHALTYTRSGAGLERDVR